MLGTLLIVLLLLHKIYFQQYFDNYNRKFHKVREPFLWNEYEDDIENFKFQNIVPHIVAMEQSEKRYTWRPVIFELFMFLLPNHILYFFSMESFLDEKLKKHSFLPTSNKIVKLKIKESDELTNDSGKAEVNCHTGVCLET